MAKPVPRRDRVRRGAGFVIAAGAALLLGAAAGVGTTGAEGAEGEEDGIPPGVEESKVSEKPNRLIHEKSPYLLQHAHNPVDWYPWGEEAFEKARKEGKPIFLSIGYSTCHWCHVMERESFENEEIARYLNEHFVSIKVDREERPDVDGIYMDATQAMNRRGGWPLSAFLRPDGKPFFTGTYFPPDAFLSICEQIVRAWEERREKIDEIADAVAQHLRESAGAPAGGALEESHARNAYLAFRGSHDRSFGGFGTAPKFPRTSILDFLMRYERRTGEREALDIVENTLDHMIRGGIRDHLAGGFHRYSTDRRWLLPHFEKMLYDNALITRTLLDAYRISGRDEYLRVAGETLEYLLSKMRSPEGAFYSAEDADAAGEEGLTYVWTRPEIIETLGEDRGEAFCEYYGVRAEGNFEPERPGEEAKSLNVLHIALEGGEEELASKLETPLEEVRRNLAEDRAKLLAVRSRRPQPFLDDKVLVEWNGLAISALAHAYQAIGEERYLRAAEKAADFIATRMEQDGRLQRRYRAGEVAIAAFLEDYAFFTEGLIDLYEAGFDERWLREAVRLGKETLRLFWDGEEGGFFSSAADHEELIARRKEFYDGAVPSGNSVAFSNLVRLREITGDPSLDAPIRRFQEIAAGLLEPSPTAHPQALCAAEFLFQKPLEIVIVGPLSHETTRAMLSEVQRRFLPSKVVLHAESGEAAERLASLSPLLESRTAIGGDPTAFVCRDRVCKLPARDRAGLRSQLDDPPPAAE